MAELLRLTENAMVAGRHLQDSQSKEAVQAWQTVKECLDGIRDVLETAKEVTKGDMPRVEQGLDQVRP